jgi:hypothetical protein
LKVIGAAALKRPMRVCIRPDQSFALDLTKAIRGRIRQSIALLWPLRRAEVNLGENVGRHQIN